MTILAWVLVAGGPVFDPVLQPSDLVDPRGVEVAQIERHLSQVEATLRRTAPADATDEVLAARERALDALHAYWTAGVFPKNRDFPDRRVSYFIDADGTACAVGHLMIASGDEAMAREIATYENNDFLSEIDHPGVASWLARNGITAEEAAWIQPAYGPCGFGEPMPVCGIDGKSYACEGIALQCADTSVQSMGLCPDDTDADVIGSEICMTDSTGADDSTDSEGSESGEPSDDDGGDDKKGCRVGDPPSGTAVLLLLLAFARRRL